MKFRESEIIELKKSTAESKEAAISIVAILNKHGAGELYFGIKNDGEVVGQDVNEKTLRDVSQVISDNVEPKIYPEIKKVKIDGSYCIYVSFSGEARPYYAFGKAYMRVGDSDRQVSASELERLILHKNRDKMQWDNQLADCSIRDIDSRLVREFVRKANKAGRIDFGFKSVKTTLGKLGLMRNGKILRAAQVLFSSKNPVKVQAAVFAGVEKLTFLDIQQFDGQSLFGLLKDSSEYVKKNMTWRVKFGKLEREEIPEIPVDALREAIINSLCHRDYSSPQNNYIAIYRDRIEIDNPGTFPENLEPEDYIFKDEPSNPRNPLIADVLFRSKDIERWGSGLKRIYDECKANGVKVEFKKMKTGFRVVFFRPKPSLGTTQKTTKKLPRNYLETTKKIFEEIAKNPRITISELAKATGLTVDGVRYNLKKLKRDRIIKRIGSDRGGRWEVVKP